MFGPARHENFTTYHKYMYATVFFGLWIWIIPILQCFNDIFFGIFLTEMSLFISILYADFLVLHLLNYVLGIKHLCIECSVHSTVSYMLHSSSFIELLLPRISVLKTHG